MEKQIGRYTIFLGLKRLGKKVIMPKLDEENLKEDIEKMLPEGFSFKQGLFSSHKPSHGIWQQKKFLNRATIRCDVVREHQDYRTPDGMSTWYWTYHISIQYSVTKIFGISLGNEEKLDAICCNIAQMIEDKYEVKITETRSVINTSNGSKDLQCRSHSSLTGPNIKRQGIIDNLITNMVYVEGGTFMMGGTEEQGGDESYDEKPAHKVTLSSFSIGKYEVTQEEWEVVMGSNPSMYKGAKHPVECVSWEDCQEFIKKLNSLTGKRFRLPTEAEWEFAARGGIKSKHYKYAGSNTLIDVAWYEDNSYYVGELGEEDKSSPNYGPHPVGQKKPNELGLHDMSGNVYEWCQDWYDYEYYSKSPSSNPCNKTVASNRVCRGGGWVKWGRDTWYCRVSNRDSWAPDRHRNSLGFRLVL